MVKKLDADGISYRLLVMPDHPTPIRVRTHTADSVPYLLYDSTKEQSHSWAYNEEEAGKTENFVAEGHTLIDYLFSGK